MSQDRTYTFKLSTIVAWVLLLVISQQLLTQWTVRAAGNRDVIDYISFAGTVVGMLLAVLAIIYSYLTTASQRDDAQALRGQIGSLNDAIERAQATGGEFTVQLERLEEIRQGISVATSNTAAVLEASDRVETMLAEMRGAAEKTKVPSEAGSRFDSVSVVTYFAERALPRQVILFYLALIEDIDSSDDREKNELIGFLTANKAALLHLIIRGEVMGYFWLFYDLDVSLRKDEAKRTKFFEALLKRIPKLTEASFGKDLELAESTRLGVKLVEEKIRLRLAGNSDAKPAPQPEPESP